MTLEGIDLMSISQNTWLLSFNLSPKTDPKYLETLILQNLKPQHPNTLNPVKTVSNPATLQP